MAAAAAATIPTFLSSSQKNPSALSKLFFSRSPTFKPLFSSSSPSISFSSSLCGRVPQARLPRLLWPPLRRIPHPLHRPQPVPIPLHHHRRRRKLRLRLLPRAPPSPLGASGVSAIVAESYARIFFRNSVATDEVYPVESEGRICEECSTGDVVTVELEENRLINHTTGKEYRLKPIGDAGPVIQAGGIFAYARKTGMIASTTP
ncbi:hypothetical protein AAC387_Pa06g0106 [Persea americana]